MDGPTLADDETIGLHRTRLGTVLVAGRIAQGRGLPAGSTRRHPAWGLTFLTAGTGRYRDARHDAAIGAGTLVLVFPGHPHWYGADRGGWDEHFVVFEGPLFDLARQRGALSPARPLVRDLPVVRWGHRLAAFGERRRPTSVGARDAEAAELLAILLDAAATGGLRPRVAAAETDWVSRSVELLESDLSETLDLRGVAAEVSMSYEAWRRRFRETTGTSPYAHRAERRLTAATELLLHTGLAVRDVATATGFSDERHLIRRFRERTGLTPRTFRDVDR